MPLASALSSPLAAATSISGLTLADIIASGGGEPVAVVTGGRVRGWQRYMVRGREGFETRTTPD